jgi:hypothetical protein
MTWEIHLILTYFTVCIYSSELSGHYYAQLNNLSSCFKLVAEKICQLIYQGKPAFNAEIIELIVDSLPIILNANRICAK